MLQTVKQQSSSLQIALMLTNEVFTNLSFYITCELLPMKIKFQWEYGLKKYHKLQLFTFTNHTVVNRVEVYNFYYRVFCVCMPWIIQSFLRESLNYKDA